MSPFREIGLGRSADYLFSVWKRYHGGDLVVGKRRQRREREEVKGNAKGNF